MNYKTELQSNNADLAAILNTVNALPEAGSGGSAPVEEKDVNFYDYDGTLLYSYTLDEVQELTELPPAPTPKKDFLVFDEWNWTLEQIKSLNLPVDVGATYTTVDGGVYAIVNISDVDLMTVTLNFAINAGSGAMCTLDWGDGTVETISYGYSGAESSVSPSHTYSALGRYIIVIRSNYRYSIGRGIGLPFVDKSNKYVLEEIFLYNSYIQHSGLRYQAALKHITISKQYPNITYSTFESCNSLKVLIFPSTCKTIVAEGVQEVSSLKVISFPYNMESIGYASATQSCIEKVTIPPKVKNAALGVVKSLKHIYFADGCEIFDSLFTDSAFALIKVNLPSTLKTLGTGAFRNARNLRTITFPASVVTIGAQTLNGCSSLQRVKFLPTTPPTVANANAFTGVPTTCVYEVPKGTLATYQAATNYSSIAAQMVERES